MMKDYDTTSDRDDYEFYNAHDFPELFEEKITFGLYKGNTYEWVFDHDLNYFLWLYETVKKSRKYLNHVLKNRNVKIENQKIVSKI